MTDRLFVAFTLVLAALLFGFGIDAISGYQSIRGCVPDSTRLLHDVGTLLFGAALLNVLRTQPNAVIRKN